MFNIALARPHDLEEFRDVARGLIAEDIPPRRVLWHEGKDPGLFERGFLPSGEPLLVPGAFVRLAEDVICHQERERLPLLYELLWRLTHGERELLSIPADPLVYRLRRMQKAIGREVHKMHAFVRFRQVEAEEGERFVAWFEPEHQILALAAPFFVGRFSAMRWSILTPFGSLHWDGEALHEGEPVRREDAPTEDGLEDWWRTYYRATFNPSRANPDLMRAEMPKRYWRNLPEARLIPDMLADAAERTGGMIATAPTEPRKLIRPFARSEPAPARTPLDELAREAAGCQRCPLHKPATQTVFGAGPPDARVVMVGEQPGDQEDLAGKAFVGPAGQLLDRALAEAGIDRSTVYVTNAVKHFKFEPRGKRRIHRKPDRPEIEACRWWLDRELATLKPELVVALGGTAAQALLGRPVKVLSERGAIVPNPRGFKVLLTIHPSMVLRLPDENARRRNFEALVADLSKAA